MAENSKNDPQDPLHPRGELHGPEARSKSDVFLVATPCSIAIGYRPFGRPCRLRLAGVELPVLLDFPLYIRRGLWLQQDGALRSFGRQVTAFLNQHFQNRWIVRQGPVAWPPRSPDLIILDCIFVFLV